MGLKYTSDKEEEEEEEDVEEVVVVTINKDKRKIDFKVRKKKRNTKKHPKTLSNWAMRR